MKKYNELNYKEKFKRTLLIAPFALLLNIAIYIFLDDRFMAIVYILFLSIVFLLQLIYNYIKWKKEE